MTSPTPKKGELKMPKKPIFDFSSKNGLCHFSRLVVPYLHTKNQKNCRRGQGWAAVTDIHTYLHTYIHTEAIL